ncbi:Uncharacterized protein dnl_16190 [Desulfonema limicola]|uniref:Uncharacterized protein n=1 Tax=Desulfonema limicola TaxID=45656 RepID=A0A975B5V6_9BACT|nr:Uncharacterized protein dnl_16190 [Desulfonema limicola]
MLKTLNNKIFLIFRIFKKNLELMAFNLHYEINQETYGGEL